MRRKVVVFTDLDGTLLDRDTYSYEEALPALELMRERGVPLVMVSSKTRPEMEQLRRDLRNADPFVVENGAAVYLPRGYFSQSYRSDRPQGGYDVVELAVSRERALEALMEAARASAVEVRPVSRMSIDEIVAATGLDPHKAAMAMAREYDEPFLVVEGDAALLCRELRRRGFECFRGGRFHHVIGGSDKGRAVRLLRSMFEREYGEVFTVALGDSRNDMPMLAEVDCGVLLAGAAAGGGDGEKVGDGVRVSPGVGPSGWRCEVIRVLTRHLKR